MHRVLSVDGGGKEGSRWKSRKILGQIVNFLALLLVLVLQITLGYDLKKIKLNTAPRI